MFVAKGVWGTQLLYAGDFFLPMKEALTSIFTDRSEWMKQDFGSVWIKPPPCYCCYARQAFPSKWHSQPWFFSAISTKDISKKITSNFFGGIVQTYEGDLHRNVHVGGGVTWRAFKSRWWLAILLKEHAQASKCLTWKIRMTFRHRQWTERCTHA